MNETRSCFTLKPFRRRRGKCVSSQSPQTKERLCVCVCAAAAWSIFISFVSTMHNEHASKLIVNVFWPHLGDANDLSFFFVGHRIEYRYWQNTQTRRQTHSHSHTPHTHTNLLRSRIFSTSPNMLGFVWMPHHHHRHHQTGHRNDVLVFLSSLRQFHFFWTAACLHVFTPKLIGNEKKKKEFEIDNENIFFLFRFCVREIGTVVVFVSILYVYNIHIAELLYTRRDRGDRKKNLNLFISSSEIAHKFLFYYTYFFFIRFLAFLVKT